jgi:hypothetical protein
MRPNTLPIHTPDLAGTNEELRDPTVGWTVREFARRYRVGEDKVRDWIARGELRAVNTAAVACGKPRWVIPSEALTEFERRRVGGPPPTPRRRRRPPALIDFFPD